MGEVAERKTKGMTVGQMQKWFVDGIEKLGVQLDVAGSRGVRWEQRALDAEKRADEAERRVAEDGRAEGARIDMAISRSMSRCAKCGSHLP